MQLRDYQQQALDQLNDLWSDGHSRQTLVLPCGTGKTVVAAALVATHAPRLTVMLVPTVHLLAQTIDRFADVVTTRFLAVCSRTLLSDDDVPDAVRAGEDTDLAADLSEADIAAATGQKVTTDPDEIIAALRGGDGTPLVVVGTYASVTALATALQECGAADLLICDEAHHTTGPATKAWAAPLSDTLLPAHRRLFMTATTRIVVAPDDLPDDADDTSIDIVSMDNIDVYGPHVAPLSFRAAITAGYLSDYRIGVVAVAHRDAALAVSQAHARGDRIDARAAAAQLALLNYLTRHPHVRSIMVFHNSIEDSRGWAEQMRRIARIEHSDIHVFHVDGTSHPSHRTAALNALADASRVSIVTNCRLFSEGVDVPALDAVMFAGPRSSGPDIIQIVGRAIRPHPEGLDRKALILLPVLEQPGDRAPIDVKVARTSHLAAWQVLTTLAEEDEYINEALLSWRGSVEANTEPDERTLSRVALDTTLLDSVGVEDFRLHLINRTTSHYVLTAQKLQVFANSPGGHANPPLSYHSPDGYPLGRRVRDTKVAYRAGRLPDSIAQLFLRVPGFTFDTTRSRAPQRSVEDWIDLIATHTTKTGIRTVHRWEKTTDPGTGTAAPIGVWLHDKAAKPGYLSDLQRQMLEGVAVIPSRRR